MFKNVVIALFIAFAAIMSIQAQDDDQYNDSTPMPLGQWNLFLDQYYNPDYQNITTLQSQVSNLENNVAGLISGDKKIAVVDSAATPMSSGKGINADADESSVINGVVETPVSDSDINLHATNGSTINLVYGGNGIAKKENDTSFAESENGQTSEQSSIQQAQPALPPAAPAKNAYVLTASEKEILNTRVYLPPNNALGWNEGYYYNWQLIGMDPSSPLYDAYIEACKKGGILNPVKSLWEK